MSLKNRVNTAKKVLADGKSRIMVLSLAVVALLAMVVGVMKFRKSTSLPGGASSSITTNVPNISAIPGMGNPTREYIKLQEEQNAQLARKALAEGKVALPTVVRTTYVNSGVSLDRMGSASVEGCGIEELQRARLAGVQASELRCRGCSLEALRAAGFSAADLKKAGFSAAELKKAGFSATELKEAGFDAKELLDAGFSVTELKESGFEVAELLAAGVNVADLVNAGFSAAELKAGGVSVKDLLAAGVSVEDLLASGFSVGELIKAGVKESDLLRAGVSAQALEEARNLATFGQRCDVQSLQKSRKEGVDIKELRKLGCDAATLRMAGFSAEELKAAGFSAGELSKAGFGVNELRAAGFSAAELKKAGFSAEALKAAGFDASELLAAGFTAAELAKAKFTAEELLKAGVSVADLRKAGFSAEALLSAGVKAEELLAAGFSKGDLLRAGANVSGDLLKEERCDINNLKKAKKEGVNLRELRKLGCDAAALRMAGFSAAELKAAGFSARELSKAGFGVNELRAAGFSATELKEAGFSAEALKAAGFSASDLLKAGFTTEELARANFSAKELLKAGVSLANLRKAGFTAEELLEAGVSVEKLLAAGFSKEDLARAGKANLLKEERCSSANLKKAKAKGISTKELSKLNCGAEALREAGFSLAELKKLGFSDKELLEAGYSASELIASISKEEKCTPAVLVLAKRNGVPIESLAECGIETLRNAGYSEEDLSKIDNGDKAREAMMADLLAEEDSSAHESLQKEVAANEPNLSKVDRENQLSTMQSIMLNQSNQLFSAWNPAGPQQFVAAIKEEGKGDEAASNPNGGDGQGTAAGETKEGDTYKAGSILFATLDTAVNSDENVPVMATIVSGKLRGTKVLGNFQRVDKKVVLTFTVLSIPYLTNSIPFSSVAIDPETARAALASDVDSHYLLRFGSLMGTSFLEGLGDAFKDSGSSIQTTTSGSVVTSPALTVSEKLLVAAGGMASKVASENKHLATTPPTVRVTEGSSLGLLLTSDLFVPKNN